MKKKSKEMYYDLNVMIWKDEDEFAYSVIQEFDDAGHDHDVLVYGRAGTLTEAITITRETVIDALHQP